MQSYNESHSSIVEKLRIPIATLIMYILYASVTEVRSVKKSSIQMRVNTITNFRLTSKTHSGNESKLPAGKWSRKNKGKVFGEAGRSWSTVRHQLSDARQRLPVTIAADSIDLETQHEASGNSNITVPSPTMTSGRSVLEPEKFVTNTPSFKMPGFSRSHMTGAPASYAIPPEVVALRYDQARRDTDGNTYDAFWGNTEASLSFPMKDGVAFVEEWHPPDPNQKGPRDWMVMSVRRQLEPWQTYIHAFPSVSEYKRIVDRRYLFDGGSRPAWDLIDIRGSAIVGSYSSYNTTGKAGNGRYHAIAMAALSHLRKTNRSVRDSKLVFSKGNDEPVFTKAPELVGLPLPLVVSMTNNNHFYDIVFPTTTRKAFVGGGYYKKGLEAPKGKTPFAERRNELVWRGSDGDGLGCEFWDTEECPRKSLSGNPSLRMWKVSSLERPEIRRHLRLKLVNGSASGELECLDAGFTINPKHVKAHEASYQKAFGQAAHGWFKDKVDFKDYGYVVNVGNNGFADRFKDLLAGKNVIFQVMNNYIEWFYPGMKPYVHFIPVKHDFSDLCEKYKLISSSPESAERLAANARSFFVTSMRVEDRDEYVGEIFRQWGELWYKHISLKNYSHGVSYHPQGKTVNWP